MFNNSENFQRINHYFRQVQENLAQLDTAKIAAAIDVLLDANQREATIYIFGNGGSAATATHFANDLAKGCIVAGEKRFRAISLTDNMSLITAWANDTSYDNIFSEQLYGLVRPGDVVIGISGSGNSQNVLKAIEVAREAGAFTMGWCGYGGGKLGEMVDLAVLTDCQVMEQIEDVHMVLCHNISTRIKAILATNLAQNIVPLLQKSPIVTGEAVA